MKSKPALLKKKKPSEFESNPIPLRLKKEQRVYLNEKKRKSPLYNEQRYLRRLIELGIKAEERGEEYKDIREGKFNPNSPQSIAILKGEIIGELVEHIQVSSRHAQDVNGIQFDKLGKDVSALQATINENARLLTQIELLREQNNNLSKILLAMTGESTLTAHLTQALLGKDPEAPKIIATGLEKVEAQISKYRKLLLNEEPK